MMRSDGTGNNQLTGVVRDEPNVESIFVEVEFGVAPEDKMAVIAVIACILCLTTASIVAIEELRALHGRARSDGRAGVIFEDHR